MKKLSFLFVIVLGVLFFSCKKKEKDSNPTPTTKTTTNNYDGLLLATEYNTVTSGTMISTGGRGAAYFPSQGFITNPNTYEAANGTLLNVGAVSLNSVVFQNNKSITPGEPFYLDSTFVVFNSPLAWSVSGGSGIPAFNYTYTAVRPTYTGYAALPDTIKLSQNNTFNLTAISGADEIVISISNTSSRTKVLSGTATSVSFSPSDLSGLSASTSSDIFLEINKFSITNIGGKNFKFKIGCQVFKSIVVQ